MITLTRVALILVVLLVAPFFFIGGPDWVSPDVVRQLWNFGHVAFFAALTLLIHQYISLAHWHRWLLLSFFILLVGIAIELIQGVIGRHKSWQDIFNNLTGVWLGLFWSLAPSRIVWLGRLAALIAISPAATNVLVSASYYWQLYQQMPVINNFESAAEFQQLHFNAGRVQVVQSADNISDGQFSAKVTLNPGRYAGVRISLAVGNWTPYRQLKMHFFNPDQVPQVIVLRISDKLHDRGENRVDDRFNLPLALQAGWNNIVIPLSQIEAAPKTRAMNMGEVSSMGLFVSNLQQSKILYWDYFYLE